MPTSSPRRPVAVLFSGGLDSGILVGDLLRRDLDVTPIFIRSGLTWQREELRAARRFVEALASPRVAPPVVLDLPLADLYADHWSVTGTGIPDASTPDEAVYLPGRNVLLVVKAAVWCQLHEIDELALGVLGTSPFDDAHDAFFDHLEAALNGPPARSIHLSRPFARMDKTQVVRLGRGLPLEYTFSCLSPVDEAHCGACNKCAERKQAFRAAGLDDPTFYAALAHGVPPCSK
ncbi:MAG TPA: 7-cyano-7-deazaguanine synthase [Thermoguttaceae bacterium]|nr:7-cyano-7-deazaguanine synthase [Thermoguttaceae bacterium]